MKKYSQEWWLSLRPEQVGKETEKLVENLFAKWNEKQSFAWHRMPDAKAARGRVKAQPGDYIYRSGDNAGFLEVKALKHEYRLPRERISQLPTLLKWGMAGSKDVILVHHYTIGLWRFVYPHQIDPAATSWDLRNVVTFNSAEEALLSTGYFGL